MRERFLELWPIWRPIRDNETRLGFLYGLAGLLLVTIGPLYGITNQAMAWRGTTVWDPTTSLDLGIPFLAWTIVLYLSLFFLFYPLPLFSMPNTSEARREAMLMGQGLIVLSAVSNLIFILSPAEVHIRSQAVAGIGDAHPLFVAGFEFQWFVDSPYNAWPSLHVSQAGLITMFAIRWWRGTVWKQWAIGIAFVAMSISILTTKQHFVWDLISGLALLAVIWQYQMRPALSM